jgi:hypothetical protein
MRALRIALLGATLFTAVPALAQPAPPASAPGITEESRAAARELMQATGAAAQMEQLAPALMQQMATAMASVSNQPADKVLAIINEVILPEFRARLPEMLNQSADLWAAQLTVTELRELKAFYETPLGRRLREATPLVNAQAAVLGMRWGQEVAASAIAKHRDTLRARGLKI